MQTDPIGYEDQMNLYAYVRNDPTNFTDPSGMQAQARSLGYIIYEYFWGKGSDKEKAERLKKFNEGQLQAFVLIGEVSPYGTVVDGVRTINEAIHGENIVDNMAGMTAEEVTSALVEEILKKKFGKSSSLLLSEIAGEVVGSVVESEVGNFMETTSSDTNNSGSTGSGSHSNTSSRSDKGMSGGSVRICSGMGAEKGGCR